MNEVIQWNGMKTSLSTIQLEESLQSISMCIVTRQRSFIKLTKRLLKILEAIGLILLKYAKENEDITKVTTLCMKTHEEEQQ